jgi:hypothetical protein
MRRSRPEGHGGLSVPLQVPYHHHPHGIPRLYLPAERSAWPNGLLQKKTTTTLYITAF